MRKGCGGIRTFSDLKFLFEALSRREPESDSLENALSAMRLGIVITL